MERFVNQCRRVKKRALEIFEPLEIEDVTHWRARFAERIFELGRWVVPLGLLATLPYFLAHDLIGLILLDLALWGWLVASLRLRRSILQPSGLALVLIVGLFALSFFIAMGPGGARPNWVAMNVALAAALYGMRGVWIATSLWMTLQILLFLLIPLDSEPWRAALAQPFSTWGMTAFNVSLVSFIIGATIAFLLENMERLIARAHVSRARYKLLADNATDVIWTADEKLRFLYVSPSAEQIVGARFLALPGTPIAGVLSEASRDEVLSLLERRLGLAMQGRVEAWSPITFEAEVTRDDAPSVFTSNHVKLVPGEGDEPPIILGVTRDTTHARAVEARLRQSHKMEAIGRLAGGIAHDFNNMLCAILGNVDLLSSGLGDDHPERETVEEIAQAGQRAAALTQQLLAFSRKQVIKPRILSLTKIIERLLPMLGRLLGEDIDLRFNDEAPASARVRIDATQAEQIIINLAINARDAMPEGGALTISLRHIDSTSEASCCAQGCPSPSAQGYLMLSVRDTGAGMDPETQRRIFEPFFTTKAQGKGTGMGLATVFGIVEQNGGAIDATSKPGAGATFRICLPVCEGQSIDPTPTLLELPRLGSETVLVVEDEVAVRALAAKLLGRLGYRVLLANSGAQALRIVEEEGAEIDLLLTDVVMPQMNGRELAEALKARFPALRVLYTSGYTQEIIARHGVLDEGTRFLSKPYTLNALGASVRRALDASP